MLVPPLLAQTTRPERTGYRETSSLGDVTAFLDSLRKLSTDLRLDTLGRSAGGRAIPLAVAARPMVASPAAARRSGKPVVYVQGNIHGGEVEGKEAALILLRDIAAGPLATLLDSLILLVVPVYNPDGNDAWGPAAEHRPGQNGPARVGRRANGGGLDLNRDYVKMEAPETRAAAALFEAWDPAVFVDLHTTNGSYHGYVLTYAPGLHPDETPANAWVRDRLLPEVRKRMRRRHRQATFWYGNFRNQEPDSLGLGWETYDGRPRFGTNWVGLRGRLPILSEAYSNADFATRISATYNFVREVLGLVAEEGRTIRELAARSDAVRPDSVTVRSVLGPGVEAEVVAEITAGAGDGAGGFARRRRTGVYRSLRMPVYDRFTARRREARPTAYLLPPALEPVARLLQRHGIVVERLARPWRGDAERFRIDALSAGALFEGHRPVTVEGRWQQAAPAEAGPGWLLVSTDQPRGVLAAFLLEPASEDGVVTWNFLDDLLTPGGEAPILRTRGSAPSGETY